MRSGSGRCATGATAQHGGVPQRRAPAARWPWIVLLAAAAAASAQPPLTDLCPAAAAGQSQQTRVSAFGCYRGYGEPRYAEFVRESRYVPVSDGTRLAVDIYRPAIDGVPVAGPLPVIFTYSRYWRAAEKADGAVATELGVLPAGRRSSAIVEPAHSPYASSGVANLVRHGYVYVRAEARGTGASFGLNYGDMSGIEAQDGRDLVEWAAAQDWSTGKVGMRGHSYPGMAQHLTVSAAPPHLVAVFPAVAPFDEYQSSWAATGILRKFGLSWLAREAQADGVQKGAKGSHINPVREHPDLVARVDADADGSLRAAAREERRQNPGGDDPMRYFTVQSPAAARAIELLQQAAGGISIPDMIELLYSTPQLEQLLHRHPATRAALLQLAYYRDASPMLTGPQARGPNSLATLMPAINRSRIATYDWGGWFDFATIDTTLWHVNNRNQKKLAIGPWSHGWNEPDNPREDSQYFLDRIEELRWFDYWLKGIDNGIMDEPPVNYAIVDGPQDFTFRSAPGWPVEAARPLALHLGERAGARLLLAAPEPGTSRTPYRVDYGVTLGEHTRHHAAIGMGPRAYPFLAEHARRSLVFESAPLDADLLVTGSPVLELQVAATVADLEVDAYLEDVDAAGVPLLLTEGVILASHRTLGSPPYDNLGLPWLDGRERIVRATPPLSAERPALLEFALQPTAARFRKGHRLRLVIAGADAHTNLTVPYEPAPTLTVWSGAATASRLLLPVVTEP
jgi:predicted acyl esterase